MCWLRPARRSRDAALRVLNLRTRCPATSLKDRAEGYVLLFISHVPILLLQQCLKGGVLSYSMTQLSFFGSVVLTRHTLCA